MKNFNISNKGFTAIDLFAGAGGLSLGFHKAGFEILFATDNNSDCAKTYNLNFPDTPYILSDINHLTKDHISNLINNKSVDVIIGGPPCQGFSTIGNRASSDPKKRKKDDIRNHLFKEYIRILTEVKPKWFILENVAGLLTYRKGEVFKQILLEFKKVGYKNIEYKLINTADYGIPQIRKRVIIIGNRINKEIKFPAETHSENIKSDLKKYTTVGEVIMDIAKKYDLPNHIPLNHGEKNIKRYKLIPEGGRLPELNLPKELERKNFGNTFKRLHRNKPSLAMVPGNNAFPIHPILHRSLTPREAARIQTFPDNYVFEGHRQSQCKQVGNAVPPLLAEKIAKTIVSMMEN